MPTLAAPPPPVSSTPPTGVITEDDAVIEWVRMCSFDRCGPETQAQLARLARGAQIAIEKGHKSKGLLLRSTIPGEATLDSTAWTTFETYVKAGRILLQSGNPPQPEEIKAAQTRALRIKRPIATVRKPAAFVKRMIGRYLMMFFAGESIKPLTAGGRPRMFQGKPVDNLSFEELTTGPTSKVDTPQIAAWKAALVHCDEMRLAPPEHLVNKAKVWARNEFLSMSSRKVPTLLLAFAACFLEIGMTSPALLRACGVTHSGAPRNTLRRYLNALWDSRELSGCTTDDKKIVLEAFIDSIREHVLEWVRTNQPFTRSSMETLEL